MKNITLAFLDTETTGLDLSPTNQEVIEYSIILERDGKVIDNINRKITPSRLHLASTVALDINGYSESTWKYAISKEEAATEIGKILCGNKNLVLVGHNVSFDRGGLNALLEEVGSDKRITHRVFDTQALVYEHLFDLGLTSTSLDRVRDFLGWSKDKAHTADKDTEDCRKLFHKLYQAGMLKRLWWKLTLSKK